VNRNSGGSTSGYTGGKVSKAKKEKRKKEKED
jgi:hypothetical protein